MTADKPSNLVPKLRFAEFVDEPPWECPPLKKLAKRITQRNTHGADLRALTNSAEHGVVDQREYFDRDIATNTDNYYIVETGDYVYNPRISSTAPVGPISKNQIGTGVMSPLYTVVRFRSDANDFFAHYFRSSHWHGYLRGVSNSGARHDRMAVTNDDLMQMPIPTPSPREQQKIADCLGSLDDLIAAEGRKLEALRQHKQGLIQQLFPLPRETLPRLRFPEFRGAAEWSLPTLQQLLKIPATYGIVKAGEYRAAGVPMVRGGDIKDGKVSVDLPLVAPEIHEKFERTRLLRNEVVIALVGYPGEAAVIPDALVGANVSRAVGVLRVAPSLNPHYLAAYLNSPSGRKSFLEPSAGSAQIVVNLSDLNALQLPLPEIDEQERIACCVAALNAHFGAQSLKLDALRRHKQCLLQQLFPSPEMK